MQVKYLSSRHPQANGQVEATNKILLNALKKRLGAHKGDWVDELLEVLWAYQTTIKTPTGGMPFTLTYETKVVVPVKVGMPTYRIQHFHLICNNEHLKENQDLLKER